MKTYEEVKIWFYVFLTSALVGSNWSASRPCRFIPGYTASDTHCLGQSVGPRADLDDIENWKFSTPPGLEIRPYNRKACSRSLYLLGYRDSTSKPAKVI
jgi:hypothetical protein